MLKSEKLFRFKSVLYKHVSKILLVGSMYIFMK